MPDPSLAVVILHYGRPEVTGRVHRQLLAADPQWSERIFVLDNHAPLPYAQAWRRLNENLYWAGALDYCLRFFAAHGWSHVWFLNNDLFFISLPPHLQRAWARLRAMENAVGPVGVYSPSFEHHPYHSQMIASSTKAYRRVQFVDGVAPLINLKCWREVGLDFHGNAQGYGVDVHFSLSVSRAGWPVIVDHHLRVRHFYHSTARTIPGFLQTAAIREKAYLEQRLGSDYRALLKEFKNNFIDEERL